MLGCIDRRLITGKCRLRKDAAMKTKVLVTSIIFVLVLTCSKTFGEMLLPDGSKCADPPPVLKHPSEMGLMNSIKSPKTEILGSFGILLDGMNTAEWSRENGGKRKISYFYPTARVAITKSEGGERRTYYVPSSIPASYFPDTKEEYQYGEVKMIMEAEPNQVDTLSRRDMAVARFFSNSTIVVYAVVRNDKWITSYADIGTRGVVRDLMEPYVPVEVAIAILGGNDTKVDYPTQDKGQVVSIHRATNRTSTEENKSALPYSPTKAPLSSEKTKPYSVEVSKESGSYITEDGTVGFSWRNCRLSVNGNQLSGSLELKVWNNIRTPITQVYITVGKKVYRCVFNRVPSGSSQEQYIQTSFSFAVNYPPEDATYAINLIQTQTMGEGEGKSHIERENGGWVAQFGELKRYSSQNIIQTGPKDAQALLAKLEKAYTEGDRQSTNGCFADEYFGTYTFERPINDVRTSRGTEKFSRNGYWEPGFFGTGNYVPEFELVAIKPLEPKRAVVYLYIAYGLKLSSEEIRSVFIGQPAEDYVITIDGQKFFSRKISQNDRLQDLYSFEAKELGDKWQFTEFLSRERTTFRKSN
jgi:hypothetical protein